MVLSKNQPEAVGRGPRPAAQRAPAVQRRNTPEHKIFHSCTGATGKGQRMAKISTSVKKNRLQGLKALRDKLAKELDGCDSCRDMAALSRQLRETMKEIEAIEGQAAAVAEGAAPKTTLELIRTKHTKEA